MTISEYLFNLALAFYLAKKDDKAPSKDAYLVGWTMAKYDKLDAQASSVADKIIAGRGQRVEMSNGKKCYKSEFYFDSWLALIWDIEATQELAVVGQDWVASVKAQVKQPHGIALAGR